MLGKDKFMWFLEANITNGKYLSSFAFFCVQQLKCKKEELLFVFMLYLCGVESKFIYCTKQATTSKV